MKKKFLDRKTYLCTSLNYFPATSLPIQVSQGSGRTTIPSSSKTLTLNKWRNMEINLQWEMTELNCFLRIANALFYRLN